MKTAQDSKTQVKPFTINIPQSVLDDLQVTNVLPPLVVMAAAPCLSFWMCITRTL